MDRKRQLDRKFADYYSRSFGFARISKREVKSFLSYENGIKYRHGRKMIETRCRGHGRKTVIIIDSFHRPLFYSPTVGV